jgi:hypothetical protein
MLTSRKALMVAALCSLPAYAFAQSASGVATGGASTSPSGSSATVGSGGSAAAGGTSASTLGTAGTSTGSSGTSSSMGVGGSAAGGKASSQSKVNPDGTNGHAKAKANEGGGVWSKSMTHTKDKNGELSTRTKSMAHEPGGPPVKSTVGSSAGTSQ